MTVDPTTDRFLRRLLQRGVVRLVGGVTLVGSVVTSPVLLACSCPQQVDMVRQPVPREAMSRELTPETCQELCGGVSQSCEFEEGSDGPAVAGGERPLDGEDASVESEEAHVLCYVSSGCSIGRRPDGLRAVEPAGSFATLGAHFAEIAELEAASVVAFVELAFELEAHGAPAQLIQAAQRAALDEVEHTAVMHRLAHACGYTPTWPTATLAPPRELGAVLRTNRIEGMVGESYGAAVAGTQARRAASPLVRRVMRGIARDEGRHARLARAVHDWGAPKLGRSVRAQLEDEGGAARERLAAGLEREPPSPELGMPSASEAQAMVLALG